MEIESVRPALAFEDVKDFAGHYSVVRLVRYLQLPSEVLQRLLRVPGRVMSWCRRWSPQAHRDVVPCSSLLPQICLFSFS